MKALAPEHDADDVARRKPEQGMAHHQPNGLLIVNYRAQGGGWRLPVHAEASLCHSEPALQFSPKFVSASSSSPLNRRCMLLRVMSKRPHVSLTMITYGYVQLSKGVHLVCGGCGQCIILVHLNKHWYIMNNSQVALK